MRIDLRLALMFYRYTLFVFVLSAVALVAVLGLSCTEQDQAAPAAAQGRDVGEAAAMPSGVPSAISQAGAEGPQGGMPAGMGEARSRQVVEPEEVRRTYRDVTIEIMAADSNQQVSKVSVPIGGKAQIDGTDPKLTIEVQNFLPSFLMTDEMITSVTNDPILPAAKVRVTGEGDWEGWLFANMPDVHAYPGPKYKVLLVGFNRVDSAPTGADDDAGPSK